MSEPLKTFSTRTRKPITALVFSDDGKRLISGGADHRVRFWNIDDGECGSHAEHCWGIESLAMSPDGNVVASVSHGQRKARLKSDAVLWNLTTRKTISIPDQKGQTVRTPIFLTEADSVAFKFGYIPLYDPLTGQNGRVIHESARGDSLAVTPDGQLLVFGHFDGPLYVWDVKQRERVGEIVGHDEMVDAMCFSADGELLATWSLDATIRIWDFTTGEEVRRVKIETTPIHLGYSLDRQAWFAIDDGGLLRILGTSSENDVVVRLPQHSSVVSATTCSSKDWLAIGRSQGEISIWSIGDLLEEQRPGDTESHRGDRFSPAPPH